MKNTIKSQNLYMSLVGRSADYDECLKMANEWHEITSGQYSVVANEVDVRHNLFEVIVEVPYPLIHTQNTDNKFFETLSDFIEDTNEFNPHVTHFIRGGVK